MHAQAIFHEGGIFLFACQARVNYSTYSGRRTLRWMWRFGAASMAPGAPARTDAGGGDFWHLTLVCTSTSARSRGGAVAAQESGGTCRTSFTGDGRFGQSDRLAGGVLGYAASRRASQS